MKVLDCRWFNDVGIVRTESEYDGIRYYIKAVVHPTTAAQDAQMIAEWGSSFPKPVGDLLFGVRQPRNEYDDYLDQYGDGYDEFH